VQFTPTSLPSKKVPIKIGISIVIIALLISSYDTSKIATVQAATPQTSSTQTASTSSTLPRQFTWCFQSDQKQCKLYVTPQQSDIVNLKNQIIKNKFFLTPDWIALRNWVGDNIRYKTDLKSHGKEEYWQLPNETLKLRTGDCEDYAVLLCALLRADGWTSNTAYVVIGIKNGGFRHVWVQVIWKGITYNIEPQEDGWKTIIGDYLSLSAYHAQYKFNDKLFKTCT
jgi:predicted transglutaminase-like cysteine proteinase